MLRLFDSKKVDIESLYKNGVDIWDLYYAGRVTEALVLSEKYVTPLNPNELYRISDAANYDRAALFLERGGYEAMTQELDQIDEKKGKINDPNEVSFSPYAFKVFYTKKEFYQAMAWLDNGDRAKNNFDEMEIQSYEDKAIIALEAAFGNNKNINLNPAFTAERKMELLLGHLKLKREGDAKTLRDLEKIIQLANSTLVRIEKYLNSVFEKSARVFRYHAETIALLAIFQKWKTDFNVALTGEEKTLRVRVQNLLIRLIKYVPSYLRSELLPVLAQRNANEVENITAEVKKILFDMIMKFSERQSAMREVVLYLTLSLEKKNKSLFSQIFYYQRGAEAPSMASGMLAEIKEKLLKVLNTASPDRTQTYLDLIRVTSEEIYKEVYKPQLLQTKTILVKEEPELIPKTIIVKKGQTSEVQTILVKKEQSEVYKPVIVAGVFAGNAPKKKSKTPSGQSSSEKRSTVGLN